MLLALLLAWAAAASIAALLLWRWNRRLVRSRERLRLDRTTGKRDRVDQIAHLQSVIDAVPAMVNGKNLHSR